MASCGGAAPIGEYANRCYPAGLRVYDVCREEREEVRREPSLRLLPVLLKTRATCDAKFAFKAKIVIVRF